MIDKQTIQVFQFLPLLHCSAILLWFINYSAVLLCFMLLCYSALASVCSATVTHLWVLSHPLRSFLLPFLQFISLFWLEQPTLHSRYISPFILISLINYTSNLLGQRQKLLNNCITNRSRTMIWFSNWIVTELINHENKQWPFDHIPD